MQLTNLMLIIDYVWEEYECLRFNLHSSQVFPQISRKHA